MIHYQHHFVKTNRLSIFEMLGGMDWDRAKAQLNGWKDGQEGYVVLKKKGRPKSPQLLGYYFAVILPHSVEAFKNSQDFSLVVEHKGMKYELELTLENMDLFLKARYAAMEGIYMNKAEMNMAECAAFESWCIKWVSKWLNHEIPPADTNWKKGDKDA